MRLFTLLIFMLVIAAAPLAAQEDESCPVGQVRIDGVCGELTFSDLTPGEWHKIEPGGETSCAHATPYAYWVRIGSRNDLLVYFQGGGGCWNADTCRDTQTEF